MKIFGKSIWKKKNEAPEVEPPGVHLAFVLLKEACLPFEDQIIQAFQEFAIPGQTLKITPPEEGGEETTEGDTSRALTLEGVGSVLVALMPVAIPGGEAEEALERSISTFSDGCDKLDQHFAHLLITSIGTPESATRFESLSAFTSLIAAVMRASEAIGVYWGNAGATHPAEYFYEMLSDEGRESAQIMLWNGISRGSEPGGGISFLSLGMAQLGLPNLYIKTSLENANETFGWMFDLLSYVAQRGQPIPDGDTVGISETQKLKVTYTKSPADPEEVVWMVEA